MSLIINFSVPLLVRCCSLPIVCRSLLLLVITNCYTLGSIVYWHWSLFIIYCFSLSIIIAHCYWSICVSHCLLLIGHCSLLLIGSHCSLSLFIILVYCALFLIVHFHCLLLFTQCSSPLDGYYIFTESSSPRRRNHNAILYSAKMQSDGQSRCMDFYYHMYGEGIGSLYIEVEYNGKKHLVFQKSGDQQNIWRYGKAKLDVPYGNDFIASIS